MSEPTRNETQLGLAELKKRLSCCGTQEKFRHGTTYFAIGDAENQTDITLSEEFIHDLPKTKKYQKFIIAITERKERCAQTEQDKIAEFVLFN
jgi:hypothetical protein